MPHLHVTGSHQVMSSLVPLSRRFWRHPCLHGAVHLHCQKTTGGAKVQVCQGPFAVGPRQLQVAHESKGSLQILSRNEFRTTRASSSGPRQPGPGSAGADLSADITPLFERPLQHRCSWEELVLWRESAAERARNMGPTLSAADGGPTTDELLRELQWLLEDVAGREWAAKLALVRPRATLSTTPNQLAVTSPSPPAVAASRKDASQDIAVGLPASARGAVVPFEPSRASGEVVPLRAGIEELEGLWRARLEARVPFQYLVGCAHWRDMVVAVGEGVLIPRPETELLPDLALDAMREDPALAGMPWADLGTGSGALAAGLVWALREAAKGQKGAEGLPQVWAVDCSDAALSIARRNMERLGMQEHVHLAQGSWLDALQGRGLEGRLGGILSNPPYIPSSRVPHLQAEVGAHEPWLALVGGGHDGMECLREICTSAWRFLAPGGFIGLEARSSPWRFLTLGGFNAWEADAVAQLLQDHREDTSTPDGAPASASPDNSVQVQSTSSVLRCYEQVQVVPDCFGVRRFVTAHRVRPS